MYPILIEWGGYYLPSWHAFYLLGSGCAWWLLHRWRRLLLPEVNSRTLDGLFVLLYVSGYFGARLLSIGLEKEYREADFSWLVTPFQIGSMTLYGGILLAASALFIWSWRQKISLSGLADLLVPATLFAIAWGRLGCFLNGDDYGKPVPQHLGEAWWAVRFPNLADGVDRYPVQLMEAISCFLIVFLCAGLLRLKLPRRGALADLAISLYVVSRFSLEFLRGDERGVLLSPLLSPAQWISMLILVLWWAGRLSQPFFVKRLRFK